VTTEPLARLVRQFRDTLDADAESDAALLARLRAGRDPAAAEAVVRRHGARVWAACRKVLGPAPEAEDAFQATFLVLLRNPMAVRRSASLGAWLYGVAHRIALQARARSARQVAPPADTAAPPALPWQEACAILHEELDRLPDFTRLPLVLCYLDGLSRDEAAAQLGRTLNSVKKSLERGRELLRKRLVKRGVTLSAGLLAAVAEPVAADPPADLPTSFLTGAIRPVAAALAKAARTGVRLRLAGVGLAASVLAVGVTLGFPTAPKGDPPPQKEMPAKPAAKTEAPTDEGPKGERIAFAGRVVDPDGRPVKGAKVYLLVPDVVVGGVRPAWAERATTDAAGRFRFDQPAAGPPEFWQGIQSQLVAVADGFGLGIMPADEKGFADAEVRLARDLPIRGRVLNLEGKPVAGAKVHVVQLLAAATDDLSGWLKNAEANGWDEFAQALGTDFPRRLRGRWEPIPGLAATTTGADGRFALTGAGRERVATVAIAGDGIATARLTVLTQEGKSGTFPPYRGMRGRTGEPYYRQPFDYAATPDQPFEGRVTDRDTGAPLAGVTVRQWWSETKTDADGRYRLTGLRPGPTALDFVPGPDVPYHNRMAPGGEKDNTRTVRLDVGLLRAPWVSGKVIDERTHRPVAGARVFYKAAKGNPRAADYFDKGRSVDVEARTGPDGSFRLAGIPGKGWLFVHRDTPGVSAAERPVQGDTDRREPPAEVETSDQSAGTSPGMYQALMAVDIDPRAAKEYTITVDPGVNIPVTLTDPDGKPVTGAIALGLRSPWWQWSNPLTDKLEVPAVNPDRPRSLFFYHPARDLGLHFQPKKADAGPWTIKLQPTATVTGTLVLPDGKPYPNADLTLSFTYPGRSGPTWLPDHSKDARFKTDATGKFRFTKVIGDVDYRFGYAVFRDKFNTTTSLPFRARPGETKDLGVMKTQAPRE
jgi:RNA polymerase sigma factor (sigma-70 family)